VNITGSDVSGSINVAGRDIIHHVTVAPPNPDPPEDECHETPTANQIMGYILSRSYSRLRYGEATKNYK
jgi:hypothetical protein